MLVILFFMDAMHYKLKIWLNISYYKWSFLDYQDKGLKELKTNSVLLATNFLEFVIHKN